MTVEVLSEATCTSPVNIAVVKYWGKRDTTLLLPVNASLSGTLSQDQLQTKTTIMASHDFAMDRLWLNGVEESVDGNPRIMNVLREVRRRAAGRKDTDRLNGCKLHIATVNNFPTAAGLASSASGYACLVYTLAHVFGIVEEELSAIARIGSGSACRSMYGGWVKWEMGHECDGKDSIAVQIADETHWPEMEVVILVVSDQKKGVSSTSGMQTSIKTSSLMSHRANNVVPQRMRDMEEAILSKDFNSFARITMAESNQFHAVCLDTYPPIFYMNDVSRTIVNTVTRFNLSGNDTDSVRAAYTFDAGPNAVIYALRDNMQELLLKLVKVFPPPVDCDNYYQGFEAPSYELAEALKSPGTREFGTVQSILHTRLGTGPKLVLDPNLSLLTGCGDLKL